MSWFDFETGNLVEFKDSMIIQCKKHVLSLHFRGFQRVLISLDGSSSPCIYGSPKNWNSTHALKKALVYIKSALKRRSLKSGNTFIRPDISCLGLHTWDYQLIYCVAAVLNHKTIKSEKKASSLVSKTTIHAVPLKLYPIC